MVGRKARPERRVRAGHGIRVIPARPAVPAALPKQLHGLRFHDLRHTCAAWFIDAGAHPLQIKLRLGHQEIRTTMDTYGHLFPSAEPELAGLLDAGYRSADETPAVAAIGA